MNKTSTIIGWFYLGLSIIGAIMPTLANIDFMREFGPEFDIKLFIDMANSNPASQSLSRDLLIGASAVMTWIIIESRRLEMKRLWLILLGTITISFAFSAPLFLYLRERRLAEINNVTNPKSV